MPDIRGFFEEGGYEVLSISTNKKGHLIVRTERGEFNVGLKNFPMEFEEEKIQQIMNKLRLSF